MKKTFTKIMLLLFALVVGITSVWATEVTYTVSTKTAVTTTGTAPKDSSVTFSSDGNTAQQLTGGTGQTLTLSGYNGYKITKIVLSMRSNTSKGAGTLCYSTNAGSSYTYLVGSSGSGVSFSNSAWNGAWSTDYVDIEKTVSIECGESNVIIKVDATANSLYCQSYTLTYEVNDDRTPTTITINASEINNNIYGGNENGGVIEATIKAGETTVSGAVSWSSKVTSVATINASSGAITLVGVGTTTLTASFEGDKDYKPSTGTYNLTVINVNPNKTTIWSEDFSGYAKDDVPSGGTYSYVCADGGSTTKIYDEQLAGGDKPELLVSKNGGSYTATIPLGHCCSGDLTLTFKTNNTNIAVSSTTTGVTTTGTIASGENTITISNVTTEMENLVIVFSNSNSGNVRLDNIVLKSLVEIPVNAFNEITNNVTIPYGATSNVSSTVIIPSTQTLTINGILNVTGTLTNNGTADNLVVNDGGQLYTVSSGVNATVKNVIEAVDDWSTSADWQFIASPLTSDYTPTGSMVDDDYDLYRLNDTDWENWKKSGDHNHFNIEPGRGYLYAKSEEITLSFAGEIKPYVENGTDNTKHIDEGWNLIGNPYTFDIYINKPYYKMNDEGSDVVLVEDYYDDDNFIPAGTGVVVKSDEEGGEDITFTKTAPEEQSTGNNGNITMTLARTNMRGNAVQDKAVVSFNENMQLGKFVFNENNSKLYIPKNGEDYAIAFSDRQGDMDLHFKASELGTYTISFEGVDMDLNGVYLIDILEQKEIDLSVNPSYTFMGSPADRAARFKIVFRTTGFENAPSDIFAYQNGNEIVVSGEGELQVFDVTGRKVMTATINGVQTVNGLANGVYIFRMNEKVQKIVVR